MLNRWIGIIAAVCMIAANLALFYRDVLPAWLAGEPPRVGLELASGETLSSQVDIFDQYDERIGQSWTIARRSGETLTVRTWTLLESIQLPNGIRTPRVRIDTELSYQYADDGARLSRLMIRMHGLGVPVLVKGEDFAQGDFPCIWQVGPMRGNFRMTSEATRALGDVIRPFNRLPGLKVGQSWRLELINPMAQLLPGWKSAEMSLDTVLVRVTGRETIAHGDEKIDCFRVEARRATAWVRPDGRVVRQEIDLPVLGRLTLLDRAFDDDARRQALLMTVAESNE